MSPLDPTTSLALVAVVAASLGLLSGWAAASRRAARGRSAHRAAPSDLSVPPGSPPATRPYVDSLRAFAAEVPPIWSGHITTSRTRMETAVADLTTRFAGIVDLLEDALSAGGTAVAEEQAATFARSRERLGRVVDTLDEAIEQKQRTTEGLRSLLDLNEQMKGMTAEVQTIASKTHLLALNAAIESARLGDDGRAFGVIALEVRSLSELSRATSATIADMADQVGQAISGAFAQAQQDAQAEQGMVARAGADVQQVLEDLLQLVTGVQDSSDRLSTTAVAIRDEIASSIVQFQFQDRVGQTLGHVGDSIDSFAALVEQSALDPVAPEPLDHAALVAALRDSYTMAEEHAQHGTAPAGTRDTEITFF